MTALPAPNRWPPRLAYVAAAIFTGASGAINVSYGFAKGSDLPSSLTWAAVAGAVAIVFALSWPAVIRSLEARRWSAAAVAFAALVLSGAYSVTAALGSAAGGRMNAAAQEETTTDQRTKAEAAWQSAKRELDALAAVTPGAELQKLIQSARDELERLPAARPLAEIEARLQAIAASDPRRYGCVAINGSTKILCPKLDAERARAEQRERLSVDIAKWTAEVGSAGQRHAEARARSQAAMDKAAAELAATKPGKPANSDAKALARYLAAAGLEIGADRLNDLLVLLAVLMIEAGGGLSLALGLALQAPPAGARAASVQGAPDEPGRLRTRPASVLDTPAEHPNTAERSPLSRANSPDRAPERSAEHLSPAERSPERFPEHRRALAVRPVSGLVEWLAQQGGKAQTSQRALARALGRSPSAVHDELHRLAAAGLLTMASGPRGTFLALTAAAWPN
jgi:hypothetical protein